MYRCRLPCLAGRGGPARRRWSCIFFFFAPAAKHADKLAGLDTGVFVAAKYIAAVVDNNKNRFQIAHASFKSRKKRGRLNGVIAGLCRQERVLTHERNEMEAVQMLERGALALQDRRQPTVQLVVVIFCR